MGAQQDETLPDMENRCNARTCKQQLTPSAELWKCCEKSRCKQYLTPSPKFRQPFWPDGQRCDFSAFAQKTALHSRFKRASGIVPYNVSAGGKSTHYRLMGLKLPATFAQIPTCAPRLSGGARTVTQLVQSVMNASSAKLHKRGTVRSHGGIGQRVANKTAKSSK